MTMFTVYIDTFLLSMTLPLSYLSKMLSLLVSVFFAFIVLYGVFIGHWAIYKRIPKFSTPNGVAFDELGSG